MKNFISFSFIISLFVACVPNKTPQTQASPQRNDFISAVSSASFEAQNKDMQPAYYSFHQKSKRVSLGSGTRPKEDAITSATYYWHSSPETNSAIYSNQTGEFLGFIYETATVRKTDPSSFAEEINFDTATIPYTLRK